MNKQIDKWNLFEKMNKLIFKYIVKNNWLDFSFIVSDNLLQYSTPVNMHATI